MAVSRSESELATLRESAIVDHLVETVATIEGCQRIVDETRRRLGPIAILVNNAGIGGYREAPIWEISRDTWDETMATNLHGPFQLTRLAVKDMIDARWGRIVMVSSTAGVQGGPGMPGYCASKHGVIGLARGVAHDVAQFGVTANAVVPGWVRTKMTEERAALGEDRGGPSQNEFWSAVAADNPAGRIVTPREVAAAVAFLAGEDASGVNGEVLTVTLGALW